MLTDTGSLLLVLILLYLSDCFVIIRRQSTAFVSLLNRTWSVRLAGATFGNQQGGLQVLNPLPPLGSVFPAHPLPVSISPEAVCSYISLALTPVGRPRQIGGIMSYADMEKVEAHDKNVFINGQRFTACAGSGAARELAEGIRTLIPLQSDERAKRIRAAWTARMDVDRVAESVEHVYKSTDLLRLFCNGLWVHFFVICPIVVLRTNIEWAFLRLLMIMLCIHLPVLFLFFRAHRACCPGERSERTEALVKMALCPPMAIRACDSVSKHVLDAYHPLAVAVCLARPKAVQTIAADLVRDLSYPLPLESSADRLIDTVRWYDEMQLEEFHSFEKKHNLDISALLHQPDDPAGGNKSYCPRCRQLFTLDEGVCNDCHGVKLLSLNLKQGRNVS